ncbi:MULTISPECIES: hypothetical protein [unclassified Bradyrhizobium]|uniref:hypothetical protein n=1 Tax=unclassified Bradyrhizobium TaxID=2631580 RepID=UPI002915DA5D|nr:MULTISPECIES: hypothetical protein [unclassified Bradyrhizobium]
MSAATSGDFHLRDPAYRYAHAGYSLDQPALHPFDARVVGVKSEQVALEGAVGQRNHPERVDVISATCEV